MKVRVTTDERDKVQAMLYQFFPPVEVVGPNSFEVTVGEADVDILIEAVRELDVASTFKFLG